MKNINKINSLIVLFTIVTTFCLNGCKKKEEPVPATPSTTAPLPYGTLMVHLHEYIGENEVYEYNNTYTAMDGRKISLNKAELYISNIELEKMDGTLYAIPNAVILQVQENETYYLDTVPIGNYKSIRFHVGLDPKTNQKVPSNDTTDIFNKPDMWFGRTAQPEGYAFLNISGTIDTSKSALGADVEMKSFMYKLGSNANYKQVIMPPKNFTIIRNQTEFLHMYTDLSKLFTGVQLNNKNNLMIMSLSENETPLAKTLVNNIPAMFHYENE